MTTKNCGNCEYLYPVEGQSYHDCRESSPAVIVPSFKPGEGNQKSMEIGKIMTVWPRVSESEKGCGKFSPKK